MGAKRYKDLFIGDVSGFADRLYSAGYAEDPRYANKVKQVYNS
jgi:flagellum-specific peptidoglycan hydrolase FlgJ